MTKDYLKKEPTKTEKMLYELAMRMEMMDRSLYSTSMHLLAMGMALNIDAKKMAELLTAESSKLQDYGKLINEEIDKIRKAEEAAKPQKTEEASKAA